MTSKKFRDYLEVCREMEVLEKKREKLENSEEVREEKQFQSELQKLMDKHEKSAVEVMQIISSVDPDVDEAIAQGSTKARKKRPVQRYENPHTGEVVETRGGNHKTLNAWRKQYGKDTVQSWRTDS